MYDCVAVVAAAVAVYRCREKGIKHIDQLPLVLGLLDEGDAICPESTHIASAACRTAVTYSVHLISCWRPLAQHCLHVMLRPASCIRVVVQTRNGRRLRAVASHGCK